MFKKYFILFGYPNFLYHFVSLNINGSGMRQVFVWVTFALSQVVAISAAIEEFFHYGERWRHYRRTAESLKTQGWAILSIEWTLCELHNPRQSI